MKIHNDPSSTWPKVVNVTDFDGKFEAKGVPSMGGNSAGDLAKKLKALKPPKRPAQPPKPKLQDVELLLLLFLLLLLLKLAELSVDRNLVDLLTYIYTYTYNMTITILLNVKLIYHHSAARGSCRSSRQPCRNTPRNVWTIRTHFRWTFAADVPDPSMTVTYLKDLKKTP